MNGLAYLQVHCQSTRRLRGAHLPGGRGQQPWVSRWLGRSDPHRQIISEAGDSTSVPTCLSSKHRALNRFPTAQLAAHASRFARLHRRGLPQAPGMTRQPGRRRARTSVQSAAIALRWSTGSTVMPRGAGCSSATAASVPSVMTTRLDLDCSHRVRRELLLRPPCRSVCRMHRQRINA